MPVRRPFAVTLLALAALALPLASNAQPIRVGTEFQVNLTTVGIQDRLSLAIDVGGAFVVVWRAANQDGSGTGIMSRRFTSTGAPVGGELQINAYTINDQADADVASFAGGGFVVAWTSIDGQDGSLDGIFARRFSSGGDPVASEFQVNSTTANFQYLPAITAEADGDFVVVWVSDEGQDGGGSGIFGRRFSSAGVGLASEFQVNTYTADNQDYPELVSDGDGDFVVIWQSYTQDGSGKGTFARRFSSAGVGLASEFQVNTYTLGSQYRAAVAGDGEGDFVVAWDTSNSQDGSDDAVFARRFSSGGTPLATEFQVNSYTPDAQAVPFVGLESDGDFVVVWTSRYQDGSDNGVFAQRFSSAGAAVGEEFQVNTYTLGHQTGSSVAIAGSRYVVAWDSFNQDGSSSGVFAQRLASLITLDVDGNDRFEPLADGLLVLRYGFGFRGGALITSAVDLVGCTRCDAPAIEAYLAGLAN